MHMTSASHAAYSLIQHVLIVVLLVWTTSKAIEKKIVYVNTTNVRSAYRETHHRCPGAHIISAQRVKWAGDWVTALAYTGTCDVRVAGP